MAETNKQDKLPTPSQVRGDIQAGQTADIRRGFDPAMAPFETDAEAAGSPMTPEQADIARKTQAKPQRDKEDNYDTAMRETTTMRTESQTGKVNYLFVLVPLLAAIAIVLAVLTWIYPRAA